MKEFRFASNLVEDFGYSSLFARKNKYIKIQSREISDILSKQYSILIIHRQFDCK